MPTHKHDPALLRAIGARLKRAREAQGLTQSELAGLISIEPVTLSRYETGARGPSITTLWLCSRALGVPLPDLVDVAGGQLDSVVINDLDRALGMLRMLAGHDRELAIGALYGLVQAAGIRTFDTAEPAPSVLLAHDDVTAGHDS